MNRKLFFNLTLLILLSVFIVGCGNNSSNNDENTNENTEPMVTEAGTFPIVEEEATLSVLVKSNALVEDFETNEFTKEYEEKTGVKIDWEVVPEDGAEEKLNLILTSGDYPDVLMDLEVTEAQLRLYGDQGIFVGLNDLIDEYGVETKRMFEDVPAVEEAISTPSGEIYALPQVNDCFHCGMTQRMWIYQPWLDELGLDMPETIEEFRDVMVAFKTEDPNGNGKNDEIALSAMAKPWEERVAGFLMNPFIYSEEYVEDGEVIVPWDKPEWKEGLKFLNEMHDEDLIYSGSFTQDMETFKSIGENEEVILGAAIAGTPSQFLNVTPREESRLLDYVPVPPLKGQRGEPITPYDPSPVTRPAEFIITDSAEHPEIAFRWADAMYDEDITTRSVIGREGEEWEDADEGELGLDGEPAVWKSIKNDDNVHNLYWDQTGPSYRSREWRKSKVTPQDHQEVALWNAAEEYKPYRSETISNLPTLFFSEEESTELVKIDKTLTDYVEEMQSKFITGDADIDKEWDKYIENLESIGIDRYVEIYQTAYDEKYK